VHGGGDVGERVGEGSVEVEDRGAGHFPPGQSTLPKMVPRTVTLSTVTLIVTSSAPALLPVIVTSGVEPYWKPLMRVTRKQGEVVHTELQLVGVSGGALSQNCCVKPMPMLSFLEAGVGMTGEGVRPVASSFTA